MSTELPSINVKCLHVLLLDTLPRYRNKKLGGSFSDIVYFDIVVSFSNKQHRKELGQLLALKLHLLREFSLHNEKRRKGN